MCSPDASLRPQAVASGPKVSVPFGKAQNVRFVSNLDVVTGAVR